MRGANRKLNNELRKLRKNGSVIGAVLEKKGELEEMYRKVNDLTPNSTERTKRVAID